MKRSFRIIRAIFLCLLITGFFACETVNDADLTFHYAIESNGVVFGYIKTTIERVENTEAAEVHVKDEIKSISTALGMQINTTVNQEYRLNPDNGIFTTYLLDIDQESVLMKVSAALEGKMIRITQNMGGGTSEVPLLPDAVLTSYSLHPRVFNDFNGTGLDKKSYQVLDLLDREYHEVVYSFRGKESLELAGKSYDAMIFDTVNLEIGSKSVEWIDSNGGMMLKSKIGNLQTTYLTDRSVKRELKRFNRDAHILSPAGIMIQDYQNISYMKVKASLDPIGNWITADSLNVKGQSFKGTIENNRVEGIFEISHSRYDGSNPPPFPADYSGRDDIASYLIPEDYIESADPVLGKKARDLTEGATDSWDAAKRLARWVAEEIGYGIPGGGSSRNTYDLRNGECGAHSRLYAAFCRAVGIPSRVVWGCMYVPNNDGCFGQHAWNEIYMGEAGWVTIDTTARQTDYCDSGHIRLGVLTSKHIAYNPSEFEILDFKAGRQSFSDTADTVVPAEYRPYIGSYQGPEERVFRVLMQNGRLAVDIPNNPMIFELREPDDEGRWYLAISPELYFTFRKDDSGDVIEMDLFNQPRIPKKKSDENDLLGVPEQFRTYCGSYPIPGQGDIIVFHRRRNLAINLPPGKIFDLDGPDEEEKWQLRGGSEKFSFVKDDEGIVRAIIIYETVTLKKID